MHRGGFEIAHHFYRRTETGYSRTSKRLWRKGIEHLSDMIRLCKCLSEFRPDIIHFQWFPVPAIDQCFLPELKNIAPIVMTVHDTTAFHGSPSSRLQLIGTKSILSAVNHLVVHTPYSQAQLVKSGISSSRISVIPHGVLHYSVTTQVSAHRSEEEPNTILLFGAIKPYKGIDILIQALARLPDKVKTTTKVLIAGKAYMPLEPLIKLSEDLGVSRHIQWDIRFIPDEEIPRLFQRATVVALPYRDIDSSGVLMTALPYGKPIVATGVGGFTDILVDRVHGRVVPPGDVSAFATALTEILWDPEVRAGMGRRVQELAQLTYSWDVIAEKTEALYRQVIDQAAPRGGVR